MELHPLLEQSLLPPASCRFDAIERSGQ